MNKSTSNKSTSIRQLHLPWRKFLQSKGHWMIAWKIKNKWSTTNDWTKKKHINLDLLSSHVISLHMSSPQLRAVITIPVPCWEQLSHGIETICANPRCCLNPGGWYPGKIKPTGLILQKNYPITTRSLNTTKIWGKMILSIKLITASSWALIRLSLGCPVTQD